MKIWKDLDEGSQRIIQVTVIVLSLLVVAFCWYNIYKIDNKLNDYIVLTRSPIREVRLISAEKRDGSYYVTVVDKESAKRYEDVYVTQTCPNFRVNPGETMNIAVIFKENPTTGDKQFELGRVYDYLCTKKNMEVIDKDFLDGLKKADENFINDTPINNSQPAPTTSSGEWTPEAKKAEREALERLQKSQQNR